MKYTKFLLTTIGGLFLAIYFLLPKDFFVFQSKVDEDNVEVTPSDIVNLTIKQYSPLPPSVIDEVETFIFFLGHARSGHSIVGSILDAHPHVVIAHEAKLFSRMIENLPHYYNKSVIFNELWNNSYHSSVAGLRTEADKALKKGYTLSIDGLYQGTYVSSVQVIGDKDGGKTAAMFLRNPQNWDQVFSKIKSTVDIPIKVIHVIRNPYDNIATMLIYKTSGLRITEVKHSDKVYKLDSSAVREKTDKYFMLFQAIQEAKGKYNLDLLEVHGKDLIGNPKDSILKMCNFLGVSCSESYLETCANKLFPSESKTRYKIKWDDHLISYVQQYIMKYDSLKRYYNFDS
ncbi:uncharacterized protein [Dysidea avara]|uniref:uncharacterized protein n=1 Tax=Dysidea avara TaxID=196820 RepID=UPI00331914D7